MVRCPELHLAPDRCNEVSCDDTGCCQVFRGCQGRVWKGQYRLFYWQIDKLSLWCLLSQSLQESREESLLQSFLGRAKGVSYALGDPLNKCPLLLE